ncbi:MAG TPA: amino acid-binding ACT [Gemmataceae bacterium]|nr:amino acid-binding ACT [Gemmataceae bacterium]
MSFKMDRVHVWASEVKDEPGGVAAKLSRLAEAGTDLEYVYTQRNPDKPGHGVLCVASVVGQDQIKAAKSAGMHEVSNPIVMRLEGDNTAGLAHRLKTAWAAAGINLHGSILTVIGTKFVGYVTFDSVEDANKAARILAEVGHEKSAPAAARR